MKDFARGYIERLQRVLESVDLDDLERVTRVLAEARARKGTIFTLGNGGSASRATHFASDLNRIPANGVPPFRAIALTDNLSLITSWANDTHYDHVFQRQLENLLGRDDVVVGLSCSGDSPNVVSAIDFARSRGATTIGLLGFDGGRVKGIVDHAVCLRDGSYEVVEDAHAILCHVIACYLRGADPVERHTDKPPR